MELLRVRVGLDQGAAGRSGISPKRVPAPSDVSGASWAWLPPVMHPAACPTDCLAAARLMTLTLPAAMK